MKSLNQAIPDDGKALEPLVPAADETMLAEAEHARVTLDSLGDAVLSTDLLGRVTYLNPAAELLTGWSRTDALGRPLQEVFRIIHSTTREAAANPALRAIEGNRIVRLAPDCLLIRQDGSEIAIEDSVAPIHEQDGRTVGAVITFRDVSHAQATALRMTHLAQHDSLTGLPNRMLLNERLSQAIGQARRHRKQVALLFLDLDHFKKVNDSLGHAIGDQLLASAANRLSGHVRATDTVFRLGGDEFVILLAEISHRRDATLVADKVLAACAAPHLIGGQALHVTSSIGISVYPDDAHNAGSAMANADAAMYHAKGSGGNNCRFFRPGMKDRVARRPIAASNRTRAAGVAT